MPQLSLTKINLDKCSEIELEGTLSGFPVGSELQVTVIVRVTNDNSHIAVAAANLGTCQPD